MSQVDRLAKILVNLQRAAASSNTAPQLQAASVVDGALDFVTLVDTGEVDTDTGEPIYTESTQATMGIQEDGSATLVVVDGPEPPAPSGLSVTAGVSTLTATWDGRFVDDAAATLDHAYVAVHMAKKADVDAGSVILPSDATAASTIASLLGGSVTLSADYEPYYLTLVAVTQAGKWSPIAQVIEATPDRVDIDDLTDASVTTAKLSNEAVTAAKLANEAVTAAAIAAGAIDLPALADAVTALITNAQATATNAAAVATNAQTAAASASATAIDAAAAAAAAAGLADEKGKVLIQSAEPTVADQLPQNLWIDTTGAANTPKRWTESGWEPVTDKAATDAASAAAAAQTAAATANTIATAAQTAALAAQSAAAVAAAAAASAQSTADGKNRRINATTAPTDATGFSDGDECWVYSEDRVTALYTVVSGAWTPQVLTDATIGDLDAGKITTGYLAAARIAAASITGALIAGATITAANMVAGTITADSGIIADAAIGTAAIIDAAITNAKIADLAITNAKIADATITSAKIGDLDAGKITTGTLSADRIAASSITAAKLAATAIDGKVITGATFQTSASNPKVMMNSSGITRTNASGATTMSLTPTVYSIIDPATNVTTTFDGKGMKAALGGTAMPYASITLVPNGASSRAIMRLDDNSSGNYGEVSASSGLVSISSGQAGYGYGIVRIGGEPLGCRLVRMSAGPTLSASTWTQITNFESEEYLDYSPPESITYNLSNGRITIPSQGRYRVILTVPWASFGSSYRRIIAINKGTSSPGTTGTSLAAAQTQNSGPWWEQCIYEGMLGTGDILTAWMWTNATGSGIAGPDPTVSAAPNTSFVAHKLR